MKEIIVGKNEAGQRVDKLLFKYLNSAPKSFVYKMLRKKNIVLNDKKSEGNEILKLNDNIKIYLSDETYDKFSGNACEVKVNKSLEPIADVIFENEDILFFNKPAGVLSQKAEKDDYSLNEYLIEYMLNNGSISENELKSFKPSICNRLDRNTSGLVCCGKTLKGTQFLTRCIRERDVHKFYITIVKGIIKKSLTIDGYLIKDSKTNKVSITKDKRDNADRIITKIIPVTDNGRYSVVRIELVTGKTHQIRAHLSSIGNPIIGDVKYGDKEVNQYVRKTYKLNNQLLHAYEMIFEEAKCDKELLKGINNYTVKAELPKLFLNILKGEGFKDFLKKQRVD
ncbi:MAG: RluA family pseudouridine synthase [Lachnospiraceae bacterium]|nr:RluA family pseudouridine synthase [Lachnospiraceae bacterium]